MVTRWRLAIASITMTIATGRRTSAASALRMSRPAGDPVTRIVPCAACAVRNASARLRAAVQAFAHFLAGLEERHAFLVDRNARAGARVAAFACGPVLHREGAEATQLDAIAAGQGRCDLAENGIDDVLDVS